MDVIVRAEVKLIDQQLKHYEGLLAMLRRRQVNAGERIKDWARSGIYVLITAFLVGFFIWRIATTIQSFLDAIEFIVILMIVLTGVYAQYGSTKRERGVRAAKRGLEVKPECRDKAKAKEFSILFCDKTFRVRSEIAEEYMNREYPYDRYVKAGECEDAFLLHAGRGKEFIIPKSSIVEGTSEGLSQLLREMLGDRFRREIG